MENIFGKLVIFLKEVRMEIKKVNWPTRRETIRYTVIVIGLSLALAAFLGGLDYVYSLGLNKLIYLR